MTLDAAMGGSNRMSETGDFECIRLANMSAPSIGVWTG
jgi:hypothetical protein